MPMGMTVWPPRRRAPITDAAEASETSCSPERPPKITPTRKEDMTAVILQGAGDVPGMVGCRCQGTANVPGSGAAASARWSPRRFLAGRYLGASTLGADDGRAPLRGGVRRQPRGRPRLNRGAEAIEEIGEREAGVQALKRARALQERRGELVGLCRVLPRRG